MNVHNILIALAKMQGALAAHLGKPVGLSLVVSLAVMQTEILGAIAEEEKRG